MEGAPQKLVLMLNRGVPTSITLDFGGFKWEQILDYEGFLFRCHHCHKVGHLVKKCRLGPPQVFPQKRRLSKEEETHDTGKIDARKSKDGSTQPLIP